jgi:hypothetical protein
MTANGAPESGPNAALLAATKDLLVACVAARDYLDDPTGDGIRTVIDSAIEKAVGKDTSLSLLVKAAQEAMRKARGG